MITFKDSLKIDLKNIEATEAMANKLAKILSPGLIIYLHGDLGAGKTTLVRKTLESLGCQTPVKSPTFTLVELYELTNTKIFHFDLYRLTDPEELEFIGIRDYNFSQAIGIFEWANKGEPHIPVADLELRLDVLQAGRTASLVANTVKGLKVLQEMALANS